MEITPIVTFLRKYLIYIIAIVFALLYMDSCSNIDVLVGEKNEIEKQVEKQAENYKTLRKESIDSISKLNKLNKEIEKKIAEKDKIIEDKNKEIAKLKTEAKDKSKQFDNYDNSQFANYFSEILNDKTNIVYDYTCVSFKGDSPKKLANILLEGEVAIKEVKIKNTIILDMQDKIDLEKTISKNLKGEADILQTNLESSESLNETLSILINKQNEIIKKATRFKAKPLLIGIGIGVVGALILTN